MPEKKKKKKSAELEKSPISAAELKQLPWLQELCAGISSPEAAFGAGGVLHALKKAVLETVLEQEMSSHLGYAKHERNESSNSRNGVSSKTVQTESGPVQVSIPRDRSGTFEPQLLPKHRRRLAGFDEKVIALYSRGLSMREMSSHLKELYGAEVSPALISSVTDAVWSEAQDWLKRPLETVYPIVYLDALFVSVKHQGAVSKRAVYVGIGVTMEGEREVLGLWMEKSEGAKFWLSVLTELKNRGVKDIFFVCCDGLSGFPDAIEAAFPHAVVQTCIVHLIRAALRYVQHADKRAVVAALKAVYTAADEKAADDAMAEFEATWSEKYPTISRLWRQRWPQIVPFLAYPAPVRKMLYTTNPIESLNFQLRRVLKTKGLFPSDEAVLKLLFLAIGNAKKNWNASRDWKMALSHFAIMFEGRMPTL